MFLDELQKKCYIAICGFTTDLKHKYISYFTIARQQWLPVSTANYWEHAKYHLESNVGSRNPTCPTCQKKRKDMAKWVSGNTEF